MSHFLRILVPVDFSAESLQALRYGCAFARHDGATLDLLHAVENLAPLTFGGAEVVSTLAVQYAAEAESSARTALENLAPRTWTEGLAVERHAIQGATAETILNHARATHADLICVGTHGRGGVTRMLLGSVAEKIVQRASCNVLVVRRLERDFVKPESDTPALERVLVPIDFSERGQIALAEGAALAARFKAELHLLHVIEDTSPTTSEIAIASSVVRSYILELTRAGERQLAEQKIPGPAAAGAVKRKVVVGAPISRITSYAMDEEIDLIVMGTHGRTGASHWLLGSVAERVVRSAPCPVMVCRRSPPAPVM
jgi:nucleotide-binding universal stress UspA family protein